MVQENKNLPAMETYKPSELLAMFTAYLSRQEAYSHVVYLQGIYLKNPNHNPRWTYRYDVIRDEDTQTEITLQMTQKQSDELKDGNLVTVGGTLGRRVQNNGQIQLLLVVSRIEVVKEQVIDAVELKRVELRRYKTQIGFKNVDSSLEQILFQGGRPKVALVFAATSITMSDFNAGINAAKSAIDFVEYRANFSNSTELSNLLKQLDQQQYSVMALVRGGGGGIEAADDLLVLETITQLKTPLICAIGHVDEKLFIKNIADKVAPTPNGLGSYFSEMVELVAEKRNKSRAVLVEEVKKQFKEQLETAEKQNKELQNRLTALTKNQEEATKMHNEQVEAATKQNKELQGQLAFLNKSAETLQKEHAKQMEALQLQLKSLKEQNDKQAKDFNENIGKMQKTNSELQQSLNRLNAQNVQSAIDLAEAKAKAVELQRQLNESKKGCASGCLGMLIAIVSLIGVVCWGVMMIVSN